MVNDSRLNDFLPLENTPGHCINVILCHIQIFITCKVDRLVCDHRVFIEVSDQRLKQFLGYEQFIVCFLVHVASLWAPSILGVSRWHSIHAWLWVYREKLIFIHVNEGFHDGVCLCLQSTLTEWILSYLALKIVNEYSGYIFVIENLFSPKFL
jgi:hypothetical protein